MNTLLKGGLILALAVLGDPEKYTIRVKVEGMS